MPKGRKEWIDPGVRAADRSLETKSVSEVKQLLTGAIQTGLQRNFEAALKLRDYEPNDLAAGRDYVKAYVAYTHFVEGIHQATSGSAHQHEESAEHASHGGHTGPAGGHAEGHSGHSSHASHLPWILVVVLALGLIGETAFLVARRKVAA